MDRKKSMKSLLNEYIENSCSWSPACKKTMENYIETWIKPFVSTYKLTCNNLENDAFVDLYKYVNGSHGLKSRVVNCFRTFLLYCRENDQIDFIPKKRPPAPEKNPPGRQVGYKKPGGSKKMISFRLHPKLIKTIKKLSEEHETTQAEIIKKAIEHFGNGRA